MKAVLFDLDGTLLDTLEDLADAVNHALTACGYPERTLAEIRSFVGNGAHRLIRLACPAGTSEEQVKQVFDIFSPYYDVHYRAKTVPYAGVLEALAALNCRYAVAIVSNKPDPAVKSLCRDFFPGIFALGERPDCPRKPAPDMLFRTLEQLNCREAIYVGDSEVDILTAKNAGMACLSVTWGFRDKAALAEAGGCVFCDIPGDLVHSIEQLLEK